MCVLLDQRLNALQYSRKHLNRDRDDEICLSGSNDSEFSASNVCPARIDVKVSPSISIWKPRESLRFVCFGCLRKLLLSSVPVGGPSSGPMQSEFNKGFHSRTNQVARITEA